MARPLFTAEELAELAAFDAMVEEEPVTLEERKESRERDLKIRQRNENREAIAEYQKQYYAENREAIAEYKKQYYAENREAIAEYQKQYRAENRARHWTPLRHWRRDHGYSQAKLAEMLGVCQATISNWENGIGAPGDLMERLAGKEVRT